MEAGQRRALLILFAIVLLLRLPFLNQPVQGDDVYYLFGAQHALIDPLHPTHARYVYQGDLVDMRGHPHPPLNSWVLAALLAVFGDVYEVPFHAAYIGFSLLAVWGMWSLAKRFADWPFGATLLFISVPAFVVNGTSFEADLPFVAFWMAGIAAFVAGRLGWSMLCLGLAAMTAYQAVVATPILWAYCWFHRRRSRAAWAVALTPVVVVGAFQAFERATSGALPATVLAGYFSSYGLQQFANKLKNAGALTVHTAWLVFPALAAVAFRSRWWIGVAFGAVGLLVDPNPLFWVSFGIGAIVIIRFVLQKPNFLSAWVVIFFAAALVLFFAGSARYLLPMAAPIAIAASRERRWVVPAFAANLVLGLGLAWVNYQHWDAYRAITIPQDRRVWVAGEWGLRFYLESQGALPLERTTVPQPGDWIVSSALSAPLPVTAPMARVSEREVAPTLPLRLIGLQSKSGYSTAALGLRPFDITSHPIDRVRIDAVLERRPTLSYLPMKAPEAAEQIVSGIYALEGEWRWTSGKANVVLEPPPAVTPIRVKLYLHDNAPARHIRILVDNVQVHEQALPGPGAYTIETKPISGSAVTLEFDKTFSPPGDVRALGVILSEVGFVP